jgi:hypothetical protein
MPHSVFFPSLFIFIFENLDFFLKGQNRKAHYERKRSPWCTCRGGRCVCVCVCVCLFVCLFVCVRVCALLVQRNSLSCLSVAISPLRIVTLALV